VVVVVVDQLDIQLVDWKFDKDFLVVDKDFFGYQYLLKYNIEIIKRLFFK
jgi:hypothetical protein